MKKLKKPFLFFLALLLMMGLIGFTTHVFADDEDTEIQTSTEVATDEQDQANDTDITEDNTENKALIAEPQAVDNSSNENLIRLDLNVILDGNYIYSFPSGLNADVYINDQLVRKNVNDFNEYYAAGTKYKFVLHPDTTKYRCIETEYQGVLTSGNGDLKHVFAILYSIGERKLTVTGDEGIESIQGNGNYAIGSYATVTYTVKPGYHITKVTGDYYTQSSTTGKGGLLANDGEWTNLAGKTGTVTESYQVLAYDRTLQVHTEPDKHTITIDPNGGTYSGNSCATTIDSEYGATYELNEIPVREGYTFVGWKSENANILSGTSIYPHQHSTSFKKDDNGTVYTNYSLTFKNVNNDTTNNVNSDTTAYPSIYFFYYPYISGHKYSVQFDMRINTLNNLVYFMFRHAMCDNDWTPPDSVFINYDLPTESFNKWKHYTLTTPYAIIGDTWYPGNKYGEPIRPNVEFYAAIASGQTGKYDFDIKNIVVYDETDQKYLPSISDNAKAGTTVEMGDSDATVTAVWEPVTYTNSIYHWALGLEHAEGNNARKDAFQLNKTLFTKKYGEQIIYTANDATSIPNGYALQKICGTSSYEGSWRTYSIGTSFTQPSKSTFMEFYYWPITYTITYNLDGGKIATANPSTYNVLYGVDFTNEPTKNGYRFLGWYIGNQKVTGINVGATATFSSADDLYAKLKTRTTGNQTVTAKWEKLTDLKVNAVVSGNMGSRDKEFSFTTQFPSSLYGKNLTVEKSDGTTSTIAIDDSGVASFTLKHGESITFKDLIDEQAKDVKALPDLGIKEQDYSSEGYSTVYSVSSELDGTLVMSYKNTRQSAVPTGNHIGKGITAAVLIGIVGLVIMLRKKRK